MAKAKKKGAPKKETPKQPIATQLAVAAAVLNLVTGLIGLINKLIETMNR